MTSEGREARQREREVSFGLPLGQVAAISVVVVVVVAALVFFSADLVLVAGTLAAAAGIGALIVRQFRGGDAEALPSASPHPMAPDLSPSPAADPAIPRSAQPEARIVGAWKVIEAEPGAPVPPGAERCDLVETPAYSPERRRWLIAAGVAVAAGSIVLRIFAGWGLGFLGAAGVLLYQALFENTRTTVTLSPTGRYLAFDAGIPHAESGMDEAARFIPLVLGLAGLLIGGWMWLGGSSRAGALVFAALGAYGLYRGVRGPDAGDEPLSQVPSLRFHALANPDYPLDGASISRDPAAAAPREGGEERA